MIDLSPFQIIILILAAWRVSHLLVYEDAPFKAAIKLRGLAVRLNMAGAFGCIYCMSIWIAALLLLLVTLSPVVWWAVCWLAISGGVCLAQKATTHD